MTSLALLMRRTENGWGVYLSNGQELTHYRGLCSKQLALRYLQRYMRPAAAMRQPTDSWWRRQAERW